MQPVPTSIQSRTGIQLSLMPDPVPPPADLLGSIPQSDVGEAVTVLAQMIAQAAKQLLAEAHDE